MKYSIIIMIVLNLNILWAKGVGAGTVIKNTATLNYSLENKTFKIKSNTASNVVDQLIDLKVSWMDTQPMAVSVGETKKVLSFNVLNSGNGRDRIGLFEDALDYKSDFSLAKKVIYLDRNNNYVFDSADRIRKTFTLDADQQQMFFVVSDIDANLKAQSSSQNFVNFRAVSKIGGSGAAGRVHRGRGVNNVDAVDGFSGGLSEDEGSYRLLIANVVLSKNVTEDANHLITVQLDVQVKGEGRVKDVKIVDEIPSETLYMKNSLVLDGAMLSDQNDGDQGRYKRKYLARKAQILVSLGDLDTNSNHTITYNLTIR